MLDSDVARLYHYETRRINETVKRNIERLRNETNERQTIKYAFLAQLVEHLTLNQGVQGSNP